MCFGYPSPEYISLQERKPFSIAFSKEPGKDETRNVIRILWKRATMDLA